MPTIVALNPSRKKKKKKAGTAKKKRRKLSPLQKKYFGTKRMRAAAKKKKTAAKKTASPSKKGTGKKTMARKKRRGGRKRRRNNPSSVRGVIGGVNMFGAMKATVPLLFGALAAKFTAKKFADGGAESDNWTWKNNLLALTGGLVAAFGTSAILRKRNAAQKVFEGALLLVAYKVFTGEIAPTNQSLDAWFGDNDFDPYAGLSNYGNRGVLPTSHSNYGELGGVGDIWQGGSAEYVRGVDGRWRPVDEAHRFPRSLPARRQTRGMGDVMVTPDSRYGDVMVTPDSRYGDTDTEFSARTMAQAIEADGM